MNTKLHLTYDDIAILPKYSTINSRGFCELKTKITRNVELKIPIVSSPMDTVTETKMALKLASMGGIGFIHRFMTIGQQAEMCRNCG